MDNQFNNFNNQNQNQNQNWFSKIDKEKALFIGGIILILLLIAGGAYYYFYYYQKPSTSIFPSVENGTNPFNDIAAGKLPVSVDCAKETTDIAKDTCWQTRAVSEKNADLCKSIISNNPFVSKDSCLNLVAQAKKDIKICGLIKTTAIKANCEKVVKGQSVF
jgi:hypothetical protein